MDDENGVDTDLRLTDNAENETGFIINEDDDDLFGVIAPDSPSPNISDAGGSFSTVSGINSMGEQLSSNAPSAYISNPIDAAASRSNARTTSSINTTSDYGVRAGHRIRTLPKTPRTSRAAPSLAY